MSIRSIGIALCLVLLSVGSVRADLDLFIRDLNISARVNPNGYKADLEVRFRLSASEAELVFRSVDDAADAAIVLWLGEQSRQPLATVLKSYRQHRSRGWGAVAQSLGIKPGSASFKSLMNGRIHFPREIVDKESGGKGKKGKTKKNKHG